MPVNHIVLFQFKADASPEAVQKAVTDLLALKNSCIHPTSQKPYIRSLTGGRDNSPEGLQAGLQYGFVVEFESIADRDYYNSEDKAHEAFKKEYGPLLEKAVVLDYSF